MKPTIKRPKRRVTWGFNPVTRRVPSGKRYRRSADKARARRKIREY